LEFRRVLFRSAAQRWTRSGRSTWSSTAGRDLISSRPRPAVEDQVERPLLVHLCADGVLDLAQELRSQLHVTGLVDPVDVAERERGEVAPLLAGAQRLHGGPCVVDGGVELLVDLALHAVFFTAHHTDLD